MTKVFIVRPFGNRNVLKNGLKATENEVVKFDFDKVETELIKPAMAASGLSGGTTGEVFAAGSIVADMFSELLLADLVIADITIHNANVFYELGIRHALRDKRTILIKCSGFDDTPFDIIGYRYLAYKQDDPAGVLPVLIQTIKETLDEDRKDSPVFNVLPLLEPQDPEKYLAVPEGFIEEVDIAKNTGWQGKLTLLAYESESFTWNIPAFRLIGQALFKMKAFNNAKIVWEKIRENKPLDLQANELLATIYQRLGENEIKINRDEAISYLVKSDRAIEVLINDKNIDNYEKAEAYALKARNSKMRWLNDWTDLPDSTRGGIALQSIRLEEAFKNYEKGFSADLNHFYSGLNALALLTVIISLSQQYSGIWVNQFSSDDEANQKLNQYITKQQKLAAAVQFSITSAKEKQELSGIVDHWLNISEADFQCLTSKNPARVSGIYSKVLLAATESFYADSVVRQLKIYQNLAVLADNVSAVLNAISVNASQQKKTIHNLLFTGHMIDNPDRTTPRFPASKEAEIQQLIKDKILEEQSKLTENEALFGIAGGACGGDILFHEICEELGIPSRMHLALPRDLFIQESVAFAGIGWVNRFDKLFEKLPHPVLSEKKALPKWLSKKPNYDIWSRNNLWLLNSALENGGINMTLIALWDGKGGDGPGGTEHMVREAKAKGATMNLIDINQILT